MNMLDEVLTRSALMTKDFIKVFVKDVASVKDQMVNTDKLKMYIKARYFDKYDDAALFYNLLRHFGSLYSIWIMMIAKKTERLISTHY